MLKLALNHKYGMNLLSFFQERKRKGGCVCVCGGGGGAGYGLYEEGDMERTKDLGAKGAKNEAKKLAEIQCIYIYML